MLHLPCTDMSRSTGSTCPCRAPGLLQEHVPVRQVGISPRHRGLMSVLIWLHIVFGSLTPCQSRCISQGTPLRGAVLFSFRSRWSE